MQSNIPFQHVFYHSTGEIYVGGLKARRNAVDRCLSDPGTGDLPFLDQCDEAINKGLNMYWDFEQVSTLSCPFKFILKDPKIFCTWGQICICGNLRYRIYTCSPGSHDEVSGIFQCSESQRKSGLSWVRTRLPQTLLSLLLSPWGTYAPQGKCRRINPDRAYNLSSDYNSMGTGHPEDIHSSNAYRPQW